MWLLAETETDRKSDVERKSSTDPFSLRPQQPVSTDTSTSSSSNASAAAVTTATATNATPVVAAIPAAAAATATTPDAHAAALAGIFDEFDWDLDSAESLQCLSEEDLKKRHSVMIEKVC